jgi:methyl-accepting chemotaxis protein
MKIKLNLRQKLQISTISIIVFTIISSRIFLNYKSQQAIIQNGKTYSTILASKYASEIEQKLNINLTIVRTLSQVMSFYRIVPDSSWMKIVPNIYLEVAKNNLQIDNLWDSWEMSAYNPKYKKPYGRFTMAVYNSPNGQIYKEEYKSLTGDSKQYAKNKAKNAENIHEPYLYAFDKIKDHEVLITDLTSPIRDADGNFAGLVGADIQLTKIQSIVNKIKPYENSISYLISSEGVYISNPDESLVGSNASKDLNLNQNIEQIKKGKQIAFTQIENEEEYYYIFTPINIGNTHSPWSLVLKIPMNDLENSLRSSGDNLAIFIAIFTIILISVLVYLITKRITKPIHSITKIFENLSKGYISNDMLTNYKTGDEFEEISNALNQYIKGLSDKVSFAEEIGKQNYHNIELTLLSENDKLGQSLIAMQNSLSQASITEEKRKMEEEHTIWANEGYAKFGEILRTGSDNQSHFYNSIIINLVKYVKVNQGGLFLLNDNDEEDKYLELVSMYAYDRQKYTSKRIEIGENLVGQCFLEKESIFLTEVPQQYVQITSGLGEANPSCIFIVPIIFNETVYGIIELASFTVLEEYKRKFIEKLGEAIGSSISIYKVNLKTRKLLEDSKEKSEELASQEEEIRQNLEELQTTQEESARREQEMSNLIGALQSSFNITELDLKGRIANINHNYARVIGLPADSLLGNQWLTYVESDDLDFNEILEIIENKSFLKRKTNLISGVEILETYLLIRDVDESPVKVLNMAINLNE